MVKKNLLVILTVFSLAAAGIFPAGSLAEEAKKEVLEELSSEKHDVEKSEDEYEEGEVIVTLAAPCMTSLTQEGKTSFDSSIMIEESLDFGGAETLGKTKMQKRYLEDKSLYIVEAASKKYSTAELIDKLEGREYVVSVEPNYKHRMIDERNEAEKNRKTSAGSAGGGRDSDNDAGNSDSGSSTDTENSDSGVNLRDYQWHLDGGKTGSSGINWSSFDQSGIKEEQVVAVVDSGIDFTHEDLKDNMWINTTGELKGTYGYDCVKNTGDPIDTDGHGTHCAGIIGGKGGQTGIQGVCGKVKMMALNIFDKEDEADTISIARAYNYIYKAQQMGVNIAAVNCSWGGGTTAAAEKVLIDKIGKRGALFVFSSGNDGSNQDRAEKRTTPYDINSDYVIIVGSTDTADQMSAFSDYGKNSVDFFAPGSQILSDVPYDEFYPLLLSEKKREEACLFFSSGEEGDVSVSDFSGVKDIRHDRADVYGDSGSGSYRLVLKEPGESNKTTHVYMDVTDYDLSSAKYFYVSCDYGYEEGSQVIWETWYAERTPEDLKVIDGKVYVSILGITDTSNVAYIDNFAISVPNLSDDYMVKYEQYSGTSMAAPIVSGAIAVLAGLRVNDSAMERKKLLYNCLRKKDSLADRSIYGGIFDMSAMSEITPDVNPDPNRTPLPVETAGAVYTPYPYAAPYPIFTSSPVSSPNAGGSSEISGTGSGNISKKILVKKVKLNKQNVKLKVGKKLKLKAVISPKNATNKKVKWYVKKKDSKYIKVSKKGVVTAKKKGRGRKGKVYAVAKDASKKKAYCVVKII